MEKSNENIFVNIKKEDLKKAEDSKLIKIIQDDVCFYLEDRDYQDLTKEVMMEKNPYKYLIEESDFKDKKLLYESDMFFFERRNEYFNKTKMSNDPIELLSSKYLSNEDRFLYN